MKRRSKRYTTATGSAKTRRPPIIRQWSSMAALIAECTKLPPHGGNSERWIYGTDWPDEATTGTGLLMGDAPAAAVAAYDRIRAGMGIPAGAAGTAPTRRRRHVYADQGDEIDVDRLNTGHARPWRATRQGREAPIIRLALNIALSSDNDADGFAATAAHAAAIADALTVAGYGVEIIGTAAVVNNREEQRGIVYTFPLKGAGELLDIRRILSVAAPGFVRRFLMPMFYTDSDQNPTCGVCRLPDGFSEIIGTPHIVAQHWENGRQVTAQEQARRIIDATAQAQAA